MTQVLRVPGLGMQQDSATVVKWHVAPEDRVEADELVVELETEKTVLEVEAAESGVLRRVYADVGDSVKPNTPLALVAEPDENVERLEADIDGLPGDDASSSADETEPTPDEASRSTDQNQAGPDESSTGEPASASGSETRSERVSPRAKRRAEEIGIDLTRVEGTGPDGAILEADVEAAGTGDENRTLRESREFTEIRRTIAQRLQKSATEAVHVTLDRTADAEALLDAVETAKEQLDPDVSLVDVLLVALSESLAEHPAFNATVTDDTHHIYEEHNVGIAIDYERGLITPVIEDVGSKSLEAVASERRQLTERALAGECTTADLEGGTFTVSNLGQFGVESFTPVINPPQVAILGVNALEDEGVPSVGGDTPEVEVRKQLPLSLSFDHRVVDGADAARFLDTLVGYLEDPYRLLPDELGNAATTEPPSRSVTARTTGGLAGTVTAGSYEWSFDEPEDLGGTGAAPTPVDRFLGSLGACLAASIGYQADIRGADLSSVEVAVDGQPDHGSLESIDVEVMLESEADDDVLERIVDLGERGCHVAAVLRDDLVPSVSWSRS